MMLLTLLVVSKAPPSAEKSAMMLSYFTLWSVVGPLIHALLPAAGPVFFAQMGYGDRFAGLHGSPETQHLTDYLWAVYSGTGFGPGSGISAMPSMHIATTAWMIIGFYVLARRWIAPMAIAGLLIFLLSISLGWHYAMDGIVGATSAVLCCLLFRSFYRRRFPDPSLSGELPGKPA
jgi:membrane-associated phospholipid phosphatase